VQLYPAIDIREGRAVRLRQGRFDQQTVYADDPLEAARGWVDAGARRLHVVDLDGARDGHPAALGHLTAIASQLEVEVQFGGGLRSLEAISAALEAGAARVVVGTAAYRDPAMLEAALERYGDRVAVAVDVRDGRVATAGWTETTALQAAEAARELERRGVTTVVYTDADRDGTLDGPDVDGVRRVADAMEHGRLICSGGIGTLADLEALRGLGAPELSGVIVGKALYEGRFTIAEAAAAVGETD
jgi:phosphoribosylformimino-5-aminoimidazole carboxamide ribotide isomerase